MRRVAQNCAELRSEAQRHLVVVERLVVAVEVHARAPLGGVHLDDHEALLDVGDLALPLSVPPKFHWLSNGVLESS